MLHGQQTQATTAGDCLPAPFCRAQLFFQPLSQSLRMVMHLGEPLPSDRPTFYFDFGVLVSFFLCAPAPASRIPTTSLDASAQLDSLPSSPAFRHACAA